MAVSIPAYNGTCLEANATTVIRTGRGVLHGITINTKGASSNVITVYDGLSAGGTLLATIDSTVDPTIFLYDITFTTGLTIVIATGTAAKVTVSWVSQ
jgi:hypothetical protein